MAAWALHGDDAAGDTVAARVLLLHQSRCFGIAVAADEEAS
jgi:hypothetical protein